jgi:hypothetical protein
VRRARWVGSTGLVIVIILGAIVAEGYRHGRQLQPVTVHPVDHALAGLPPGGVLYLPVNTPDEPFPYTTLLRQADFVYRDTAGHRPIANGYAAFFPSSYFQLGSEVRSLPSPPALAALETIGVRYVVVPADGTAGIWAPLTDPATAAPLRLIRRDSHDVLYEVPAAPARR